VDERFVEEAENITLPRPGISPWIRAASMAACLCLILFGLHKLPPYLRGETEGAAGQRAEDAMPEGAYENSLEQESMIQTPGEMTAGEVPSVILHVEEMTDLGFTATVAQLVDTDIFEIGMELNVVVAEGTRQESLEDTPSMAAEDGADYAGAYVMVQFVEYRKETGTIVVNIIQVVDPPETTP